MKTTNPKTEEVILTSKHLLIIAFIEGAAVMACELLGAKMIAPFFGTTLYSWASVLAITLGGLASGYYLGGWLTQKYQPVRLLQIILFASALLLFVMPIWSTTVMKLLVDTEILTGLLISLFLFLLPPILLFGMVSPVIIHALVHSLNDTGKMAGRVYAVSTLGGVLNTLLIGFYLLPNFGILIPSLLNGALLLVAAISLLPLKKKLISGLLALFSFFVLGSHYQQLSSEIPHSQFRIIHHSEGMMGQVKVVDYNVKLEPYGIIPVRGLLVNNTWQTVINRNDGVALLDYIYFSRPLLSALKPGSKALLIGLGGGTLCREMQTKGLQVDVVEIDPRLQKISYQYFGLHPSTNVVCDDGRHFLQQCQTQYDLIFFDAFLGENPPWHLLTKQSFEKVQQLLKPGGKLMIEFFGFAEGNFGKAGRSLHKTLEASGFSHIDVVATSEKEGIERNFIYVASNKALNFDSLDYSGTKYTDKKITDLRHWLIKEPFWKGEAVVFEDDLPALELMLAQPSIEWRKELNQMYRNRMMEQEVQIFY